MSFKLGHTHSEKAKRNMSIAQKGRKHSKETKEKISMANKGRISGMAGKQHSIKTKQKMSESSFIKGRGHTEESKQKMSEALKGRIPWNKGISRTIEEKEKMSIGQIKRFENPEARQKIAQIHRIIYLNKRKKSLQKGAQLSPFYNERACKYFKQFDEINNTEGQYATNGGELCVLGYWLDYINHSKKIIIEWDEEAHYVNGKLKEKDIIKQKEIEKHFPDYIFIRIREAEYIPKVNELFPRLVDNGI